MVKFKRVIFTPVPCTPPEHTVSGFTFLREDDVHMARFLHHDSFLARRAYVYAFLASVWILGSVSGIWAYAYAGDTLLPMMRSSLSGSVSIVDLLSVTALPFLLSAFAVFISCPCLVFPIAFFKGFTAMFTAMGFLHAFGSAGWLTRLLLCFTEVTSIPILYWYWLCCLKKQDKLWHLQSFFAASLLILAGSIDYCLIAPFLADLIIL